MKVITLVLSFAFISLAQARTVARVVEVNGNAFKFGTGSHPRALGYGSKIEDLAEIMVEDGSSLTLINNSDDKIHVNGGSLVKFYNGSIELKNGHVWLEANSKVGHLVHSSNAVAQYRNGQFIFSHDNSSGKSQLLVLTGSVKYSNALEPNLKINVPSGYFSFVEQGYENGLPRRATKVGLKSYKKIRSVFAQFDSLKKNNFDHMFRGESTTVNKRSRSIASVTSTRGASKVRGKLITFKTYTRAPASTGKSSLNYYKSIQSAEKKRFQKSKTGNTAKIRVFGSSTKSTVMAPAKKELRKPASVAQSSLVKELRSSRSEATLFESSLKTQVETAPKHSPELNTLIDELKSYKKDYQKRY